MKKKIRSERRFFCEIAFVGLVHEACHFIQQNHLLVLYTLIMIPTPIPFYIYIEGEMQQMW